MLEKLITNLKNSLPAPIREKLGIAEEKQEDSEESKDFDDSDTDSEASSGEVSEEEQKKKRNSMMLRVVIILGLAYFAVDEFILKTEENATEEIVGAKPKRKRPVKKAAEEVAATNAASETAQGASNPIQETPSETVTEAPSQTPPPIENINVLDKNETPDQKLDQLVSEVGPTPTPSFNEAPAESSSETPAEPPKEIPSEPTMESPSQSSFGESSQSTSISTSSNESMEIPTELPTEQITIPSQPKDQQNNSMASKIAEEATETPPPAYDQVGRGLVYNCKDKYWACLNKTAYVVCNKNMKWNKSKGSAAECVVQNIYSSDEDCAKVQKYNVSTSVPTAFCQN